MAEPRGQAGGRKGDGAHALREPAVPRRAEIDRRPRQRHVAGGAILAAKAGERHGGAAGIEHGDAPGDGRVGKIVNEIEDTNHRRVTAAGLRGKSGRLPRRALSWRVSGR